MDCVDIFLFFLFQVGLCESDIILLNIFYDFQWIVLAMIYFHGVHQIFFLSYDNICADASDDTFFVCYVWF